MSSTVRSDSPVPVYFRSSFPVPVHSTGACKFCITRYDAKNHKPFVAIPCGDGICGECSRKLTDRTVCFICQKNITGAVPNNDLLELIKQKAAEGGVASRTTSPTFEKGTESDNLYIRARNGDAASQAMVGYCFMEGLNGFPKSETDAVRWYEKGAAQKEPRAMLNLAVCHQMGMGGLKRSHEKAKELYEELVDQGNLGAMSNLAILLLGKDDKRAIELFTKAAQAGAKNAQYELGICYSAGKGVEQSNTEALTWLGKAAEQGHKKAQRRLQKLQGTPLQQPTPAASPASYVVSLVGFQSNNRSPESIAESKAEK